MTNRKALILIAYLSLITSVSEGQAKQPAPIQVKLDPILHYDDHVYDVSIIQLFANPDKYTGKRVRVQGYFVLEFEGTALYLHQEDYDHTIFANSLWVNLDNNSYKDAAKCSRHYVMIEATFDVGNTGHMGLFVNGALTDVKDIKVWPPYSDKQ